MKRLSAIFSLIALLAFQACEGPMGPPGPPGLDGLDGVTIVGKAFEFGGNFTAANDYQISFTFPSANLASDKVLVYLLVGEFEGEDIWRLMPQTYYLDNGILVYNFDFTRRDVICFLDGAIDPSTLGSDFTQNQIFRAIVIPADPANFRMDYSDYTATMEYYGIEEEDFIKTYPRN
ncbi:MAG TPA: hypothetical protein DEQ87_19775 [Algoriphagus sp.]|jgi:hypothetical protein|uniref:hypothetical protein n=1 Tax=Algoriphagus TaxID=246875 RepID=UPI000C478E64|nr:MULTISPECIES: hypothetical protein [Algoriphagus]MAL12437.1 hypothetical protein [Algoriphagus sp.]MAN88306.1 hypothetical protein [Algoriphagus sp.]HAH35258.1 hypothetical protein [Algoriphagus sp.]HAS58777.1 hypothetical protein [Algoriphagus sp.]HAZ26281.1 hypothetical protein [Algoriphagus sp.]|tara:strand:- start:1975 stop:2502 length:528 start_codon:yes stop_codon:yes gene_type:complete